MNLSDVLTFGFTNAAWSLEEIATDNDAANYARLRWYGPGDKPSLATFQAAEAAAVAAKAIVTARPITAPTGAKVIADLKSYPVPTTSIVAVSGNLAPADGNGGVYYWDMTDTTSADDTTYYSVVTSSLTSTGRWKRLYAKIVAYAHGILVVNHRSRTFMGKMNTDSNGEITINLTAENTSGGTAFFTDIWNKRADATAAAGTVIDCTPKATAANLKTQTFTCTKPTPATLLNLGIITTGLMYSPNTSVGSGVSIDFRIEGV